MEEDLFPFLSTVRPVAEQVALTQRIRHYRQVTFHIVTKPRLASIFLRIKQQKQNVTTPRGTLRTNL